MLKLLWLCSWYPDEISPYNGDFIQRHAQAASLYNQIHVIKLTPDAQASGVHFVTKNDALFPNLTEQWIYYAKNKSLSGKLKSYYRWFTLYKKAIKAYIDHQGLPDLVHVHIPFQSGLIALWLKRKYKLPFVVTEHWGGYNHVVPGNFFTRGPLFKWVIKNTFKQAAAFHSVSHYLGTAIVQHISKTAYEVIPNVVDTTLFNWKTATPYSAGKFKLLHISNGVGIKNVPGIIETFSRLDRNKFSLKIIGLPDSLNSRLSAAHPDIEFSGVLAYCQVAALLKQADILLIFSHLENSPCVIGEALCCGKPVIATRVGGIPELVDASNSILVEPGETTALKTAIEEMSRNYSEYQLAQIAEKASSRFSFEVIARQLNQWYLRTLSGTVAR